MTHLLYLLVLASLPVAQAAGGSTEWTGALGMMAFLLLLAVRVRRIRHLSHVTRKSTAAFRERRTPASAA